MQPSRQIRNRTRLGTRGRGEHRAKAASTARARNGVTRRVPAMLMVRILTGTALRARGLQSAVGAIDTARVNRTSPAVIGHRLRTVKSGNEKRPGEIGRRKEDCELPADSHE